jgi:hypothetical protein
MNIADQPIVNDQPQQPIFMDDVIEELFGAIADLTKVVDYLAATKTLPASEAAAFVRLHKRGVGYSFEFFNQEKGTTNESI